MAELIVVGFEGTHRAAEVLDQLQRLNAELALDLQDAVAVYRTRRGKLRVDQSMYLTTKKEAAWGGVLGAVIGALIALPVAALASIPAAAAAVGVGSAAIGATGGAVLAFDDATAWRDRYGINDEFVTEAGGMVKPGYSAVFALVQAVDPSKVAEQFQGYGGNVLRTTLAPEQSRKLQETLAARSEPIVA